MLLWNLTVGEVLNLISLRPMKGQKLTEGMKQGSFTGTLTVWLALWADSPSK